MILTKQHGDSHGLSGSAELTELEFQSLKEEIHEELVESLDLATLGKVEESAIAPQVRAVATQLLRLHSGKLGHGQQLRMLDDLMDEVFGLGPLERLMRDASIDDILVNNAHEIYVERRGRLELTDVIFADDAHVLRVIRRIVARVGRRIDELSPMVDARLPDGSRINAVVPPLALRGPTLSIRRFGAKPLESEELLAGGSLMPSTLEFLSAAIRARLSVLISGGTGAGKTTLLNALSAFVDPAERLVTIEDSAELILQHKHVIQLETRIANTEGMGQVTQRDLLRNCLRMRPDRILIGEVRGAEALDMLQAMNTGHEGSLTTIHANDTRDALARLEMMVAMTGFELPTAVVRQYIATGIKLVVHLSRFAGGARRVARVSEIVGVADGQFILEDIFGFEQTGVDPQGCAIGNYYTTGYRPQCLARLKAAGFTLADDLFHEHRTPLGAVP